MIRWIKKGFVFALFSSLFHVLTAQQLPSYSQYMFNKFLLNPAIAGSDGYTTLNITAREQWLGFKQAPRTHALSAQTRLLKTSYISKSTSIRRRSRKPSRSGRLGLGAYLFNDKNGIVDRTGLQLTYAYHIPMEEAQLSLGVSAIGYQYKIDEDGINVEDPDDVYLLSNKKTMFIPDAGFGIYLASSDYYAGFSVSQLFQASLKLSKSSYRDFKLKRHYYLMGGYAFDLRNDFIIEPSLLLKTTEDFIPQLDMNLKVFYMESYWGGLSYRTDGDLVFMAGAKVEQYYFGYAFDYALSEISRHSFGSHEFMFAVKFGESARRYRWTTRY